MKLILQHGGQSVEYEFVTAEGAALTNAQAAAGISLAYERWKKSVEELPENPTVAEKAALLLALMADHMMHAARSQRRAELAAATDSQIATELG